MLTLGSVVVSLLLSEVMKSAMLPQVLAADSNIVNFVSDLSGNMQLKIFLYFKCPNLKV